MPLLYVNDLAAGAHLAMDTAVDQRIRDAIDRLLARQGSNGSFGLWSAGGDDAWLDAYVTDFLTRAREKRICGAGCRVQAARSTGCATPSSTPTSPTRTAAANSPTALYVLARNGAAPIGDLRYLADTKLSNLATPIAKAQLAAALALVGDKGGRSGSIPPRSKASRRSRCIEFGRVDYGSALARCRGAGDAGLRRQRAAGDADARRCNVSRRRAG